MREKRWEWAKPMPIGARIKEVKGRWFLKGALLRECERGCAGAGDRGLRRRGNRSGYGSDLLRCKRDSRRK